MTWSLNLTSCHSFPAHYYLEDVDPTILFLWGCCASFDYYLYHYYLPPNKIKSWISMQFTITKNISSELTVFSSVSFGNVQWHWKISPKMGLYGFLATDPFLPAWKAERYHFTTWTIRSLASFWSLMLQGRKTKFNVLLSDRTWADAALLHMVHYKPGREDPGPRVFKTET